MTSSGKWKKLLHDVDTISYVKELSEYRIIIEARQFEEGWEIVKKYLGGGMNFVETYSAQTSGELRRLLKQLRNEKDLSRSEIKDITKFKRRSLKVLIRRGWREPHVEKWFFSINDDYNNFITIRDGKTMEVDIVMEDQLKYIEEKIIEKLFESLGVADCNKPINQHVYYFSKKMSYFIDQDEEEDIDIRYLVD